jgi:arylsulfatase A-like enzyme
MEQIFLDMSRRDFLRLLGLGTAALILPTGCGKDNLAPWHVKYSGPAQHVIVISLDTARSDHFGCYGNSWIRTPRIDGLASESILYTNYMTVVPTTLTSHTSLFTGKYTHTHGTPRNGFRVNEHNIMLPEILKRAGFHTAGFLGSFALDSRFGFAQGFDYYDEEFDQLVGDSGADQDQRKAEAVTNAVITYIDKTGIPPHLFLFVHYFDPHKPYAPPIPYRKIYANNDGVKSWLALTQGEDIEFSIEDMNNALHYAGEVSYMDKHVGRLIDYLKQQKILDEAILIITSDHGENFKEHPENWDHGLTVYQTTMQAVGLIRLPHAIKAGTKVDQLFTNIDILPTLLKYLGLAIPDGIDGEAIDLDYAGREKSLPPRTRFGQATRPLSVETDPRWYNIRKARCAREGNLKYIQTPYEMIEELYDLSVDPYEKKNLLENAKPEIMSKAEPLKKKLISWANSANPLTSRFEPSQKEETIRRLRSLGYIK